MKTLKIIGAGVKGVFHITHEGLIHLKKSKKILWLGSIEGFDNWVSENGWQAENITHLYQNAAVDSLNYKNIKLKVLAELADFQDVALVLLGHPRLGVTIVQEFQDQLNQSGEFNLLVLPGISSFDTMINDIALDPIEEGSCILDANRLLLYDYIMEPCLNYFIYHICSIGNSKTNYENPNKRNGVEFLKIKLLKHFSEDHPVFLLSSSCSFEKPYIRIESDMKRLEELLDKVSFSSTLFIPAKLPSKQQINNPFLQYLLSS